MEQGTVLWFNKSRGYGFISRDNEARDVWFHISRYSGAGIPMTGDRVEFSVNDGERPFAGVVQPLAST